MLRPISWPARLHEMRHAVAQSVRCEDVHIGQSLEDALLFPESI